MLLRTARRRSTTIPARIRLAASTTTASRLYPATLRPYTTPNRCLHGPGRRQMMDGRPAAVAHRHVLEAHGRRAHRLPPAVALEGQLAGNRTRAPEDLAGPRAIILLEHGAQRARAAGQGIERVRAHEDRLRAAIGDTALPLLAGGGQRHQIVTGALDDPGDSTA